MRHSSHFPAGSLSRRIGLTLPSLALFAGSFLPVHAQPPASLTPSAQQQLAEIGAFKKTFTEAEKKMSFNLILLSRQAHHQSLGAMARFIDPGPIDATGKVVVDLNADLSPSLMTSQVMNSARQIDGDVPQSAFTSHHLRTHVAAADLLDLASSSDVRTLREASRAHTNTGLRRAHGEQGCGAWRHRLRCQRRRPV